MKSDLTSAMCALAERDARVTLLTGDLGYAAFETFSDRFPSQFLNCGVAEQNMVGVAAGLASEGIRPMIYSIGNFLVLRAAEQIRNDIVAPGRPALLVAAGAGFNYGAAGFSHHLTEDLAFARSLPGLTVFAPSVPTDVRAMLDDWHAEPRPVYLRLERTSSYDAASCGDFIKGAWRSLREGSGVAIFATGGTVAEALVAADGLGHAGVYPAVIDCNQLTGVKSDYLDDVLGSLTLAVSIEEHSIHGGLSSLIAEEIAVRGLGVKLLRFGIDSPYTKHAGGAGYLRSEYGITAEAVIEGILDGVMR